MAYDPVKTQHLLTTAAGLYSRMPGSEFIQELAAQLKEAEKAHNDAFSATRAAIQDKTNTEAMLKTEQRLRNELDEKCTRYSDALEKIAAGKEKKAKQLAQDAINPPTPSQPENAPQPIASAN